MYESKSNLDWAWAACINRCVFSSSTHGGNKDGDGDGDDDDDDDNVNDDVDRDDEIVTFEEIVDVEEGQ